jgi:hypothetical protein
MIRNSIFILKINWLFRIFLATKKQERKIIKCHEIILK